MAIAKLRACSGDGKMKTLETMPSAASPRDAHLTADSYFSPITSCGRQTIHLTVTSDLRNAGQLRFQLPSRFSLTSWLCAASRDLAHSQEFEARAAAIHRPCRSRNTRHPHKHPYMDHASPNAARDRMYLVRARGPSRPVAQH